MMLPNMVYHKNSLNIYSPYFQNTDSSLQVSHDIKEKVGGVQIFLIMIFHKIV